MEERISGFVKDEF